MKKIKNILSLCLLSMLLAGFVGCSDDDEQAERQTVTISVPISVASGHTATVTRAPGDPGVDDELPAPRFLYVWCTVKDGYATPGYQILFQELTTTADDWNFTPDGILDTDGTFTPDESFVTDDDQNARYILKEPVTFISERLVATGRVGRVYAIASYDDLGEKVNALNTTLGVSAGKLSSFVEESAFTSKLNTLKAAAFDLSSWQSANAAAHSTALGNLYSTPWYKAGAYGTADEGTNSADATDGNGVVRFDGSSKVTTTTTRLYHCAAKADFKWETAAALQATTTVSIITVTDLPTTLTVFDPTHNAVGTATCPVLAATGAVHTLNIGNQWIGREYAYVLQPPVTTNNGKLDYTVTFANPKGGTEPVRTQVGSYLQPTTPDEVYTGWYRINAKIE